jgi:hypothetical protein
VLIEPPPSSEEAAAIVAALARFITDTQPPTPERQPPSNAWLQVARTEAVERDPRII